MNAPNAEIKRILQTTLAVLKNPAGFFETMPVSGGFADPVVFLAAMGEFFKGMEAGSKE